MDGFELSARSYEALLLQDDKEYDKEDIKRQIAALRTVSGKSEADINAIFDTGAFNDICKGYLKKTLQNCDISEKKIDELAAELKWLFDTMSAEQARNIS